MALCDLLETNRNGMDFKTSGEFLKHGLNSTMYLYNNGIYLQVFANFVFIDTS